MRLRARLSLSLGANRTQHGTTETQASGPLARAVTGNGNHSAHGNRSMLEPADWFLPCDASQPVKHADYVCSKHRSLTGQPEVICSGRKHIPCVKMRQFVPLRCSKQHATQRMG